LRKNEIDTIKLNVYRWSTNGLIVSDMIGSTNLVWIGFDTILGSRL